MRSSEQISRVSLDALAPAGALLVIAPHPDDETLGCGGLIALARDAGRAVWVVVLTDGAGSHPSSVDYSPMQVAALREDELRRGVEALGLEPAKLVKLALADGRLSEGSPQTLSNRIQSALGDTTIGAIFAPGEDDPHPDHQTAARAAKRLAEPCEAYLWNYPVRAHVIEAYLQASQNLVRLDVSAALERKRAALACHVSQLGELIRDDAEGFYLTPDDIAQHTRPWELYRRARAPMY